MKKEDIKRLSDQYPHLWSYSLLTLPEGWTAAAEQLLADLHAVNPPAEGYYGHTIPLHILHDRGFAMAFASVSDMGPGTPEQAHAVMTAVGRFRKACCNACEVCGQRSVSLYKEYTGGNQQMLCQAHIDERLWKSNVDIRADLIWQKGDDHD